MTKRPLRWRVLDAADRVRDGVGCAAATAVTAIMIGATALPRRSKPGPEQWMADRRAARERLVTNREQRSRDGSTPRDPRDPRSAGGRRGS